MLIKILPAITLLTVGVWSKSALLGSKECTWGPTYWCQNLTAAHGCHAVSHCIANDWVHRSVADDPDDVCTICKNMVGEARQQLESNMTMEELKEVLEGSCKLMIIKPVVKICDKLTDEYLPELVETIASQMNPDVVCSVAGLCNNAEIDKALAEKSLARVSVKKDSLFTPKVIDNAQRNCDICGTFVNRTTQKIAESKPEEILGYLLDLCGKTSSYSDSCASIVLENQETIIPIIQGPIESREFCHLTGSCVSARKPLPGDEPCDLCQQLVLHFRDIVAADTTEAEFKKVLLGICKQTHKFAEECKSLVNEYSDKIFKIIRDDLDGRKICGFLNICPAPGTYFNGFIAPMLPAPPIPIINIPKVKPTIAFGDVISRIIKPEGNFVAGPTLMLDEKVNGREECVFCQYLLHYIQKVISQPYGVEAIKKAVDKVCDELPKSVSVQCENFVNLYGDAFVAVLAQEIDPSQVCPSLHICPAIIKADHYEPEPLTGKPGCPLCLMAISALDEELANNKTEDSIKDALKKVCNRLPKVLVDECNDLVNSYTEQLVDMIEADFTPEEVCTYLKLCKKPDVEVLATKKGQLIEKPGTVTKKPVEVTEKPDLAVLTNEVGLPEEVTEEEKKGPQCILCEFIMEKFEDLVKDNRTQGDIDRVLHEVCDHLPRTVRKDCEKYVVKYGEEIINTLAIMVPPEEVCTYMGMCLGKTMENLKTNIADCAICQQLSQIYEIIALGGDSNVDRARFLMNACDGVEANDGQKCRSFMRKYGVLMFNAMDIDDNKNEKNVCVRLSFCSAAQTATVTLPTVGKRSPLGADKCTRGPGYWCKSQENAKKCGTAAMKHCQENVWP